MNILVQIFEEIITRHWKMSKIMTGFTRRPDTDFLDNNIADVIDFDEKSEILIKNSGKYKLKGDRRPVRVQVFSEKQRLGAVNANNIDRELQSKLDKCSKEKSPILRTLDYASDVDGKFYIIQDDYNHSLEEFVKLGKHSKWKDTLIKQMLHALRYLHEDINLLHGALSPENIVIRQEKHSKPKLKVSGLTRSRFRRCQTKDMAKIVGQTARKTSDFAKDVFSTAMIIVFILTGNVINPVKVNSDSCYLQQVLQQSNELSSAYTIDDMCPLLNQMLSKDLEAIPTIQQILNEKQHHVFFSFTKKSTRLKIENEKVLKPRRLNGKFISEQEKYETALTTINRNPTIHENIIIRIHQSTLSIQLYSENLKFIRNQDQGIYSYTFDVEKMFPKIDIKKLSKFCNQVALHFVQTRTCSDALSTIHASELMRAILEEILVQCYDDDAMNSNCKSQLQKYHRNHQDHPDHYQEGLY